MESFYPESRFGGFTDVDGTIAFYTRVRALLGPSSVVIDVGCGRGQYGEDRVPIRRDLRILRGRCGRVIGIDVDPTGSENPFVDEFRLIEDSRWPVEDGAGDLCLCDAVLEHVADPDAFFAECRRALKPGGYLCIRTPNRFSYFGLMATVIPSKYHAAVVEKLQDDRQRRDVFPTLYRCNTRWKIQQMFRRYGFDGCVRGYEAEPGYLSFSRLFYALGVLHQRLAPNVLKAGLVAFGRRRP